MEASQDISDISGSPSMQGHQGKAQDMLQSFDCRHNTQEFGVPGDKNPLESRSTNVQPDYHSTVALDWTRVGGVVHESEGVCMTDVTKWEPKYVPTWDNLPRWEHPRFKPNCSRR